MILRIEKQESYVVVDKQFVNDINLSFKAKGILLYMLSKPNGWNFYETEIAENSIDGVKRVKTGISELIKQKYIERRQLRVDNKFAGYEYVVHEISPLCRFRITGNRITQNGQLVTNDGSNVMNEVSNEKNKTPTAINSVGADVISDEIDVFVDETYPTLYSSRYSAKHPTLAAYQRKRTKQILREFSAKYTVSSKELEDAAKEFLKREISDGNIKAFADSKMLYYMLVSTLRTDLTAYA